MTVLVVDASVAAKWHLPEPDSPAAVALLGQGLDLKAPALLREEILAAITRAYRNGRVIRGAAEQLVLDASAMFTAGAVDLVDTSPLHPRAANIALDLKYPFIDCLYIALAEREGCDLVTTDATLLSRAQAHFSFVKAL
ncbi:MAG: type II toxin-antitoxin system VapC family toxin [Hyphomonadaceae bacterium]|nr:type II toxin-antitoxin system VapC family toxin [Hyphomonadaceae bacterium]